MDSETRHAYAVLELSPPVSGAALKRQYRTLAKRWHPDRYTSDPVGQAEAAQRMRQINQAFRVVATSLGAEVPEVGDTALTSQDPVFVLSRADIDKIVASINRSSAWSLRPQMSPNRWLSVATVMLYLVVGTAILPAESSGEPGIVRAVGPAAGYFLLPLFLLPLFLIWKADAEDTSREARIMFRRFGWILIAAPAFVGLVIWMRG